MSRPHPSLLALLVSAGTFAIAGCASTPARDAAMPSAMPTARIDVPQIRHPEEETPAWWFRMGAAQAAERDAMSGKAKNVILFVGDGMSLTTVAAARILEGQRINPAGGEEHRLSWEKFPHTALSKTYNTDTQTPDSAGTMSAMATGVKTRAGVLSIGQQAVRGDCKAALGAPLLTLWELAATSGMAIGVVTTTRVTHATPGATLSHSAHRNWENDTDLPADAVEAGCVDIARQMIETPYGTGPSVLMGGGRGNLLPVNVTDPEYSDKVGLRLDGRDLTETWKQRHPGGVYVWNTEQLQKAPADTPLIGLFEPDHMQYEHDRRRDGKGEPALADMVKTAIQRLQVQSRGQGYVLLVESGRIDHAHHSGNAFRALTDTVALSDAVRVAAETTSEDDTLILVTADHSHTLTFAGYPVRGNPILGKVKGSSGEGNAIGPYATDATGMPYTTLSYANGPGYAGATDQQPEGPKTLNYEVSGFQTAEHGRPDLNDVDTETPNYLQEAMIPLGYETHGGDDVGIWARGPGAHAVRGSLEQNTIFHILLQATPKLRQRLCAENLCNADGVPVELPDPGAFLTK